MLATLLMEAGDLAATEHRPAQSWLCYLKSLHLLLDILAKHDAGELPDFLPRVEMLRHALGTRPLPAETQAMLMREYERTGQFAKAENLLFALIESGPENGVVLEFGHAFYRRLLAKGDAELAAGELPREEIEAGLKELGDRLSADKNSN